MSKVLAVGDIHTKSWILLAVHKLIDQYDHIVFVGDYADDWKATPQDTIDTWRMLRMIMAGYPEKVTAVKGNHDYIYTHYTKSISSGYNKVTQMLLDSDVNNLKHWLSALPITHEIDGVTYSHAGVTEEWKTNGGDLWSNESPIWIRPIVPNYSARRQYLPNQVFGHTPSETCWEVEPNVWCIDTFSTYPNGDEYGDHTVLEIIDGKQFNKIKLEENKDDNNSSTSEQSGVS